MAILEDRSRPGRFGVSFASLMAMVAMMIHASGDFSLQIPTNATWFVVLCLLPFCIRDRKRSKERLSNLSFRPQVQ